MEPTVTTVSTTVVVTVWMILLVTDRLVTVKGDANRDIPTRSATMYKKIIKRLQGKYFPLFIYTIKQADNIKISNCS